MEFQGPEFRIIHISILQFFSAERNFNKKNTSQLHKVNWPVWVNVEVGVSENWGISKSSILMGVFPYKPSIFGYHYFRKHPSVFFFFFPCCKKTQFKRSRAPDFWWPKIAGAWEVFASEFSLIKVYSKKGAWHDCWNAPLENQHICWKLMLGRLFHFLLKWSVGHPKMDLAREM